MNFLDAFNKLTKLYDLQESAADKQKFIDKFGQKNFDAFLKAKDRLKNVGKSVDMTWYIAHMSVEELESLLQSLYDKASDKQKLRQLQGTDKNIRGQYNYLGNINGFEVYQPLDYIASMDLGVNTGWCTTGRYGHALKPNYTPNARTAQQHFDTYTREGKDFYYLLDPKTMYGKYAIVILKEHCADSKIKDIDINLDANGNGEAVYWTKTLQNTPTLNVVLHSIWTDTDKMLDKRHINPTLEDIVDQILASQYNRKEEVAAVYGDKDIYKVTTVKNFFELSEDGAIVDYFGEITPGCVIKIPEEAMLVKDIYVSRFKELFLRNKDLIKEIHCNASKVAIMREIPKVSQIDIIDSTTGEILRKPTDDLFKGLYFINCKYVSTSGSLNSRRFKLGQRGAGSVAAAGTTEIVRPTEYILFKDEASAENFMQNFIAAKTPTLKQGASYVYSVVPVTVTSKLSAIQDIINFGLTNTDYVEANTMYGPALVYDMANINT